jgi:hypothetical protein
MDPTSTRVEPQIGSTPVSSAMAKDELRAAVEPADSSSARAAAISAPESGPAPGPRHDQLSRIEDKAARIEEKYARSEAILQRVGSTVETATSRMNEVASQAELAALRDQVRRLPGKGALFAVAVITPLLTAAIVYLLLQYGIPGALPR